MKYFFFILLIVKGAMSFAQAPVRKTMSKADSIQQARIEQRKKLAEFQRNKPKPIENEFHAGIQLQGSGTFLHFDRFLLKNDETQFDRGFYVDLGEIKHPDQYRLYLQTVPDPVQTKKSNILNSYVYGKQNNLYVLRTGYQVKKKLSGHMHAKNIQLEYLLGAGLNLGMVKPYYIAVRQSLGFDSPFLSYSEANKDYFLNYFYVNGSAGFSKGLNEMSYILGFNTKQAIQFNLYPTKRKVVSCQLGLMTDLFTEPVPMMIQVKNKAVFTSVFASVSLGKRWE